jgi:hypothetical protein
MLEVRKFVSRLCKVLHKHGKLCSYGLEFATSEINFSVTYDLERVITYNSSAMYSNNCIMPL